MHSVWGKKQKMCTVVDLPTSILSSLLAALMFTGIHNQFPLLTMVYLRSSTEIKNLYAFRRKDWNSHKLYTWVCRISSRWSLRTSQISTQWISSMFISWPSQMMLISSSIKKRGFFWATETEWCSYRQTNQSTLLDRVVRVRTWPQHLCYVFAQDILLSRYLSPQRTDV